MDMLFRVRGGLDLAFQLATTDGVSIRLQYNRFLNTDINKLLLINCLQCLFSWHFTRC